MASAEVTTVPATDVLDSYTLHSQPTQVPVGSSIPTEVDIDSGQTTDPIPARSLFGPFPSSEGQDEAEQQTPGSLRAPPVSVSPSADQIRPNSDNHQYINQLSLDSDPHDPETFPPVHTDQTSSPTNTSAPPLTREKTAPAIGPATDKPTPLPKESETEGPVLYITLLLSSTGARHPYKLDAKYLKKRNVVVDGNNPINISLYKLKELILRDWREEWEAKPSSPESIRLISMGKLLNDKARLSDSGFTTGTTPHIIHMTIKPQDIVDEEDAKMKATGGVRGENERSPGCRCVIQ